MMVMRLVSNCLLLELYAFICTTCSQCDNKTQYVSLYFRSKREDDKVERQSKIRKARQKERSVTSLTTVHSDTESTCWFPSQQKHNYNQPLLHCVLILGPNIVVTCVASALGCLTICLCFVSNRRTEMHLRHDEIRQKYGKTHLLFV